MYKPNSRGGFARPATAAAEARKPRIQLKKHTQIVHVKFGKGVVKEIQGEYVSILFTGLGGEEPVTKKFYIPDLMKGQQLQLWRDALQKARLRNG